MKRKRQHVSLVAISHFKTTYIKPCRTFFKIIVDILVGM